MIERRGQLRDGAGERGCVGRDRVIEVGEDAAEVAQAVREGLVVPHQGEAGVVPIAQYLGQLLVIVRRCLLDQVQLGDERIEVALLLVKGVGGDGHVSGDASQVAGGSVEILAPLRRRITQRVDDDLYIGTSISSGCIRLTNEDVIDLYRCQCLRDRDHISALDQA